MQRKIAYHIIYKTINDSSYTNLLMRKELDKLPLIQRGFVVTLVNGVLKKYNYLNYQHAAFYKNTSLKNKIILSMAIYEKFFMNSKEYAVINEYVKLAESKYDKAFINAILHKIDKLNEPQEAYLKESLPMWIYNLLAKQYSDDELNLILKNYSRIPETYYHLNTHKCSFDDLKEYDIEIVNDFLFISKENLINTEMFKNGYFYIQDINAASLINEFNFNHNDLFLDACSAPGSKLFNALEYIDDKNAYANDLNLDRVNLIKDRAKVLGFDNIHYSCLDASKLSSFYNFQFDKILLDVPCSGLGVIGRRNDIKFHIKPASLDELETIQYDILCDVSKLLKDNGYLIYSTCTLNKKENNKQIDRFLNEHKDFFLIKENTIINMIGDMFYYALIKKGI